MAADPRGPVVTVTKVEETAGGTFLTKSCGHRSRYNQIYHYKVGNEIRCFQCGPEARPIITRKPTTWHGFAFELKQDTQLGLAMLVIEYESGAYEPLAVASTINEARELAGSNLAARMRRLEKGEEVECPACYKFWAQGVDGRYLTVPVPIDPMKGYELTFEGAAGAPYFPGYVRYHRTLAQAEAEAFRVADKLGRIHDWQGHTPGGSHNPQIHAPDGSVTTVRWPL